ncbi:MAG: hypothetical protein IPM14_13765 [bacterium]|nr:hypothetical protein [bacterium]
MLSVRSKVASKISKIKEAEDFNFANWLKKPFQENYPVDALSSYLNDIPDLQLEFLVPGNSKFKFDMKEPDVHDELKNCEFKKVRSNAIFFMIADVVENSFVFRDVDVKPRTYKIKKVKFLINNPGMREVKVKFDGKPPADYQFELVVPEIFNYLSNLIPEILKIDLLDFEDLASSSKRVDITNIEIAKFKKSKIEKQPLPGLPDSKKTFNIKVPPIGVYKSKQNQIKFPEFSVPTVTEAQNFQIARGKNFYANFKLAKKESVLYYTIPDKTGKTGQNAVSPKVSQQLQDQLKFILSNVKRIDWEKNVRLHIKLKNYEESGAKFLAENECALLQDEFGIDIEKEAVAALKILFGNRVIKSALIVTDITKLGNPNFAKHLNLEIGWSDKIQKHCPDQEFHVIQGNNDERAEMWNQTKAIVLADIDTAMNDYRLKLLEAKRLDKFDCIILDSVDGILSMKEVSDEFLSSIKPKILWATTSSLNNDIQHSLNQLLNPQVKIDRVKIRSKALIVADTPKFILNEYWCDADDKQASEFKAALIEARKELRRVLESGNPLRFAANIFTLYHKLNQLGNFATGKSKSPKTELLLRHVLNIKDNGKKVLILTQYEKLGIKKISEMLTLHDIRHLTAPNGLSAEELKERITNFHQQKDIVAFISDAKTSKLKFSDIDVPYVINFDQWWSPMPNWELEDMFSKSSDEIHNESVSVLNYYSVGTLDQKVREMLLEGDLMNRNVFELMQPKIYEELITIDEWLNIFGMPVSGESKFSEDTFITSEVIKKMTIDDFRKMLVRFFTILGYSEVDILELPNSHSFNIVGKAQRNSRVFFLVARVIMENKISKADVESVIEETISPRQDKIFIISRTTLPKIDESKLRENVTLLDGQSLSGFLVRVGLTVSNKQ